MALNLLSERALNDYLIDIVYQGEPVPKQQSYSGEFESPDYVEQHRDEIIKGILNQYIKLRLRQYVLTLKNEPAFEIVDKKRSDLPGWTVQTFARGEDIYEFNGAKMSQKLRDEITMVRDFLYDEAGQYVDKVVRIARETKRKPKIRYDYLKTTNEYDTFEKALTAAKHWHENMALEIARRNKARDLLQKSLIGVEHIMDLSDGMSVYKLNTTEALDFESEYMGHCVGKGGYDEGVINNKIQIYSIRDERGEPHATFEVRDGKIYQCKGKSNKRPIAKYIPAIQEFVTRQNLKIFADAGNMGYLLINKKYVGINNLPKEAEIEGDIDLRSMDLYELPDLSRWIVHGSFICANNHLIDLKGTPKVIDGDFICNGNELINLVGVPQHVGGFFNCANNSLTSLEGAPHSIGGKFDCSYNTLTTLQGCPQVIMGDFDCSYNRLTNLVGGPQTVNKSYNCSDNTLISLQGAPQVIQEHFNCRNNKIVSLKDGPAVVHGDFNCLDNRLTSLVDGPQVVDGDYECSFNYLTDLQGAPKQIKTSFHCSNNKLISLKGAPTSVGKSFDCSHNSLTTLEYAPESVWDNFDCYGNKLISLKGAPQRIFGRFSCLGNRLTDLIGSPRIVDDFQCQNNELTSLVGAPEIVKGRFNCSINQLTDLVGAPKEVGSFFDCQRNQLVSLTGAPRVVWGGFFCLNNKLTNLIGGPEQINGEFNCSGNPIESLDGLPMGITMFYCDGPLQQEWKEIQQKPVVENYELDIHKRYFEESEEPELVPEQTAQPETRTKLSLFKRGMAKLKARLAPKIQYPRS